MKTDAETQNGGQIFVVAGGRIWQHVNNIIANCFFFHLSFFGVDFATYLCPEPRIFCCLVGLCVASLMGQQVLLL